MELNIDEANRALDDATALRGQILEGLDDDVDVFTSVVKVFVAGVDKDLLLSCVVYHVLIFSSPPLDIVSRIDLAIHGRTMMKFMEDMLSGLER